MLAMKLADMLNGVSRVVVGGIIRAGLGWVEKQKGRKARVNSVHIVSVWEGVAFE